MDYTGHKYFKIHTKDAIAKITIDNPPINILDNNVLGDLDSLLKKIERDDSIKVVIFQSANPDFFASHADLTYISKLTISPPVTRSLGTVQLIGERLRTMPKITISKISGRVRGAGNELIMATDMRFAALDKAVFGQPEIGVGFIPGGGGTQRLPRLVGRAKALEIILTAEDISAEQAEKYSYINKALPEDKLDDYVDKMAERISRFTFSSLASAKLAVNQSEPSIIEGLMTEYFEFIKLIAGEDSRRLVKAALENGAQTYDEELDLDPLLKKINKIK